MGAQAGTNVFVYNCADVVLVRFLTLLVSWVSWVQMPVLS